MADGEPAGALKELLRPAVIVAALGYFVDIYDLILFSVVRTQSLTALGLSGAQLTDEGLWLINLQMAGMLVGGVLWGMLGDRRGRRQVLFASITLYSVATIFNGLVTDTVQYGALRFVAGVGLAGELGAGVTLVAEVLPRRLRGWGTMVVASIGVSGAVVANLVSHVLDWRGAYFLGGGLGVALLLLRINVGESAMYTRTEASGVARGNFLALFATRERAVRYLASIVVGAPIWYVVGILVTFSPELAKALDVTGPVRAGDAVMAAYAGLVLGDVASGALSQLLQTRKWVVALFLLATAGAIGLFFVLPQGRDPAVMYGTCFALGLASGYWAVFVTVGAEQFGTNLRATAATTIPNFVRGMVVPMTFTFAQLREPLGLVEAAMAVGAGVMVLGFAAAFRLQETYGRELDFAEPDT